MACTTKSQHNFYLSEETRRMLNTIKAFRGDATIDDTLAFIASTKIDEVLETNSAAPKILCKSNSPIKQIITGLRCSQTAGLVSY